MVLPEMNEQFLLPFLFTLAVVFGVLRATNVFAGNRAVQMIIAFVFAYFSATYTPFVQTFFAYLPSLTTFFIGVFLLVFLLEAFGLRKEQKEKDRVLNMTIYGVLLLILIVLAAPYFYKFRNIPIIGTGENLVLLAGLGFILGIFIHAYKSEKSS